MTPHRHNIAFLSLFFAVIASAFTQDAAVDSMIRVLPHMADDTNKVNIMNKLSDRYGRLGQYDSSIYFGQQAGHLSTVLHFNVGNANAYNNIGIAYWYSGNYSKSLNALFASLKIYEKDGNKKGIAGELNNIGIVYGNEGNYAKALEYYIRTLNLKKELNDRKGISSTLINIGLVFEHDKDFEKALNYFRQSLVIKKEVNDKKGLATCLNNIGLLYINQFKNDSGLICLQQGLAIREELKDKTGIATCYDNLGHFYFGKKDYAKAEQYFEKAKNISLEIRNLELTSDNRYALAELYKNTGRWQDAYTALSEGHKAYDSLNLVTSKKESDRLEMKYEFEKEKLELQKKQEIRNTLAAEDRKKQRIILLSVSIGLVLVLIFSLFLFGRFRITKRQKALIETQKKIVDDRNKEVLDSIHYAKRIQLSLLPPEKYIERSIKRLKE